MAEIENVSQQGFIDNLINYIWETEESESVTNEMVARLFDYLNKGHKTILPIANKALNIASQNSQTLNSILGNNASQAIDNFNEILSFLEGLKDSEKLGIMLHDLRSNISKNSDNIEDLRRTGAATPRFSGIITSVIQDVTDKNFYSMSSEHRSTDVGCDVVFLQPLGIFALRVSPNAGLSPLSDEASEEGGIFDPGLGVDHGDLEASVEYKFYANWVDAQELGMRFGDIGYEPVPGVLYECTSHPYGFVRFRALGVESNYPQYEVVRVQTLGDSADIEISGNTAVLTEEAGMRSFIALFNHAAGADGKYDPENAPDAQHPFLLNGLWLTYAEAMDAFIMTAGRNAQNFGYNNNLTNYIIASAQVRTNFRPTHYSNPTYFNSFFGCGKIEVIRLNGGWPTSLTAAFHRCWKLREIFGTITFNGSFTATFDECYELQEFRINNVSNDMNLRWSPKLSYDTIAHLVDNAANTKAITITVHVDVFAKLIGDGYNEAAGALSAAELARWVELGERAYNKNITFATTV